MFPSFINLTNESTHKLAKRLKTTGKPYDNKNNEYKQEFNNKINSVLSAHKTELDRMVIIDSIKMSTSTSIINAGISKNNIETVECDKETSRVHNEFGLKSYHCLLEDFVKIPTNSPCKLFCADATGSVWTVGNPILTALQNGYFAKGTILVITMSKRIGKGKIFIEEYSKWNVLLREAASKIGLHIESKWQYQYGRPRCGQGNMLSECFIFC